MLRVLGTFFVVLLVSCGCQSNGRDDQYPSRAIKVVVPFGSGGETDTFARLIKKTIDENELLPVPLVIVNRDGASATIGSRTVMNARADGHTVLLLHNAIITAKYSGKATYGPEAFEPIAGTGEFGLVVTVSRDSKYETLDQLMQATKEEPDKVTFAANLGAPSHFAGLMLEKSLPGSLFRFTQTGSGATRYAALRGGHVDVSAFSIGEYVRFKVHLKALAYFGEKRHPQTPAVPTAREQGFDVVSTNMQFWWFPKGTDAARSRYLADVLRKAIETPYVREELEKLGCEAVFMTGEPLRNRIEAYEERVEAVSLRSPVHLPDIPVVVGSLTGCLALVWLIRRRRNRSAASSGDKRRSWGQAISCSALLVGYVTVIGLDVVHFSLATFVFVVATGLILSGLKRAAMPALVITALVLSVSLHFAIRWLTIDLS